MEAAPGTLVLYPEFAREEAVRGLQGFSHVWLLFVFHKSSGKKSRSATGNKIPWSPMVRPPRLGGNKKVGVFASRSPFRPNPIGMSAVRLESVDITETGPVLHLSGVDILDRTPILDIKPYLPYADSIPDAGDGFASGPPPTRLRVVFSEQALRQIRDRERQVPRLAEILTGILEHDPRPAYRTDREPGLEKNRMFGIRLFDFDLKFRVNDGNILVIRLDPA